MYLLLIFLSVFGAISSGFFGRFLGSKGSAIVTIICLLVSFFLSCFVFYEVSLFSCPVYLKLATWISSEVVCVDWGFMFDTLTASMCVIVTFISLLVHVYSLEYMSHDPHLPRFMSYLSLFTFFMLILVTGDNYVQMFVGWEGVGLASYLLINFWYTRIQANKAAIKAMVVNRIGDFCLLLAMFIIFTNYKALDYATVAVMTPFLQQKVSNFLICDFHLLSTIGLFLFLAAAGKSAQLGLHTWLPDAMEGPTPVSALIHAATMVTAGIFLIIRSSFIYEYADSVLELIAVFGALTSFFAASTGLLQNDLKRVIAYSTCSQLGYMVFVCGLSGYTAGFFHLSNHAFFKALLFLSAGSVIHAVNDEQDMRKMGGLKNLIPFTYSMMILGSLALAGFPFLAGFYSKDLILEVAYGKYTSVGCFSYYLGLLGAFFTAFYSLRLLYLTFLSKPNGSRAVICFAQDSGWLISCVLGCLAIPSVVVGYLTKDMIVGAGSHFFGASVYVNLSNFNTFDSEFIDVYYKILPVVFSIFGLLTALFSYIFLSNLLFEIKMTKSGRFIYNFLNRKWFFDKIYNEYLSQFFLNFSYSISYKFLDKGIFEMIGPTGLSAIILSVSSTLHKLQTGHLYHYTLAILLSSGLLFSLRQMYLIQYFFIDHRLFAILSVLFFLDYSLDENADKKSRRI